MEWTSPLALTAVVSSIGFLWLCFGIGTYWLSRSGERRQ
jgi:hypothetical protein